MSPFVNTLGPILIAVVLNTYLFGIGVYQYGVYFTSGFKDPAWIRCTIFSLLLNDIFHSCLVVYTAWGALIENFAAPPEFVQTAFWPFPVSIISVTLTAFVVQAFLSYRVLLLAKFKPLAYLCFLLTLSAFSFGLTSAIKAWDVAQGRKEPIHDILVTTWLSLEVVVDIFIAGILLCVLMKEATGSMQSIRVMKRLGKVAVQTGLCSSIFAFICMLLWLLLPHTSWYLVFGLAIGRMYSCSLLDTLLSRPVLRAMMNSRDQNSYVNASTFQTSSSTSKGRLSMRVPMSNGNSMGTMELQDLEGRKGKEAHEYARDWK